jgi:hypothetical protein
VLLTEGNEKLHVTAVLNSTADSLEFPTCDIEKKNYTKRKLVLGDFCMNPC